MSRPVRPPVGGDIRITSAAGKQRGTYVHHGTDFGPQTPGVAGDPLYAATDGVLVHQYKSSTFGWTSVLERDNGDGSYSYFVYAHQVPPPSTGEYQGITLTPERPTQKVAEGSVIGSMGNTGASAEGKPIPVHEHFEQIDTNGRADFSRGWPFSAPDRGPAGVTGSGVTWQKVGPSFRLPNGWIAKSDAGKVTVDVPAGFASSPVQDGASPIGAAGSPRPGTEGASAGVPSFEERWNAIGGNRPARPARNAPASGDYGLPSAPQLMFDPSAMRAQPQSFRTPQTGSSPVAASDNLRRLTRQAPENAPDPSSPQTSPLPFVPPTTNGLDDRFGCWAGFSNGDGEPRPADKSVGVFAREPIPIYSVQPPIWGPPDQNGSRPNDGEDWFNRWVRPLMQQ